MKKLNEFLLYISYVIAFYWSKIFNRETFNEYYQKGGCYQTYGWAPIAGWHHGPYVGICNFIFRKNKKEDKYILLSYKDNKTAPNLYTEHTISIRLDFWSQFGWSCMWYDGPIMSLHLGLIMVTFVYPLNDWMYKIYQKHEQTAPWDIKNLFRKNKKNAM